MTVNEAMQSDRVLITKQDSLTLEKILQLMNEILGGMKVLKLYAWEKSFVEQINEIRNGEIRALKLFQYLEGSQFMMWNCAPFLVAVTSFATFVMVDPVNNILDAKTAFVSLTLFNTLREPLFLLPFGIVNIIQGMVSLKRIAKYLNADEIDAILILTPHHNHADLVIKALSKGKAVYVEKPLALELQSITDIEESIYRSEFELIISL